MERCGGPEPLALRRFALEDHAHPLQDVRRDLVAAALGPEHLLQASLEIRVPRARPARNEVLLDLQAHAALELAVEVELEAAQDLLAINR
jgi:hypothetical protein